MKELANRRFCSMDSENIRKALAGENYEFLGAPPIFKDITMNKSEADRNAAVLVARLGSKWKPDVWQNSGWFYAATLTVAEGYIKIYPRNYYSNQEQEYWVDSRLPDQLFVYSTDPKQGVNDLLAKARGNAAESMRIVAALEKINAN